MPCCSVRVPFGDEITADLDVEYEIDCEGVDADSIEATCVGFWTREPRLYTAFTAKAGPEAALRDRFAEAAMVVWKGRITDACERQAGENKEVNRFVRG